MTLCPGRKGSSVAGGRWDRDLGMDLAAIRAWGADLGISLVEEHEFAGLDVRNFRETVAASGIPWAYTPIPDGGVPGATFAKTWVDIGARARNILRRGGSVVIHCRAGLGRTGMISAMLLVDFGMEPEAAIAAVRAARPHTIETKAQEAYVREYEPLAPTPERADAIAGCMIAAATGDALGAAFEFLNARAIEAALGEPFAWRYTAALPGSLLHPRAPGLPTDDTAMALSVAYVIAEGKVHTAIRFAHAFLKDLDREHGRFGAMFWTGGPGGATTNSLAKLRAGADPETCGGANDGGNGAAMRAHPVGILADRNEVLRVAAMQARVTHGHPSAVAAAQAVAVLVHDALAGFEPTLEPPDGIVDRKFIEAWRAAHKGIERGMPRLPKHLLDAEMSGWETVAAAAAIAFIYADEPVKALAAAAASGRDTDTVASIVGALVGARLGRHDRFGADRYVGTFVNEQVLAAVHALQAWDANLARERQTRFSGPISFDKVATAELFSSDVPVPGRTWGQEEDEALHNFALSFDGYGFFSATPDEYRKMATIIREIYEKQPRVLGCLSTTGLRSLLFLEQRNIHDDQDQKVTVYVRALVEAIRKRLNR